MNMRNTLLTTLAISVTTISYAIKKADYLKPSKKTKAQAEQLHKAFEAFKPCADAIATNRGDSYAIEFDQGFVKYLRTNATQIGQDLETAFDNYDIDVAREIAQTMVTEVHHIWTQHLLNPPAHPQKTDLIFAPAVIAKMASEISCAFEQLANMLNKKGKKPHAAFYVSVFGMCIESCINDLNESYNKSGIFGSDQHVPDNFKNHSWNLEKIYIYEADKALKYCSFQAEKFVQFIQNNKQLYKQLIRSFVQVLQDDKLLAKLEARAKTSYNPPSGKVTPDTLGCAIRSLDGKKNCPQTFTAFMRALEAYDDAYLREVVKPTEKYTASLRNNSDDDDDDCDCDDNN